MTMWQLLAPLWFDSIIVLGHKCAIKECGDVARWTVHWPGWEAAWEAALRCERHKLHTARIAEAMGFDLWADPVRVRDPDPDPPPTDHTAERFAAMELE